MRVRSSGMPDLTPSDTSPETAASARTVNDPGPMSPMWSAGPSAPSARFVTTMASRQGTDTSRPLAFTVTVT